MRNGPSVRRRSGVRPRRWLRRTVSGAVRSSTPSAALGRGKARLPDPQEATLRPRQGDVGEALPQRHSGVRQAGARGRPQVRREHLHVAPLRALRLVDRQRGAVHEGRPHIGHEGEERVARVRRLDPHDGAAGHHRILRPHHVDAREAAALARSEIHRLRGRGSGRAPRARRAGSGVSPAVRSRRTPAARRG